MKKLIFFIFLSFVGNAAALCTFKLTNDSDSNIFATKKDYQDSVRIPLEGTLIQPGETKQVTPQYIYGAELALWRSEKVKNQQPGEHMEGAAVTVVFKKRFVFLPGSACPQPQSVIKFSELTQQQGLKVISMGSNTY